MPLILFLCIIGLCAIPSDIIRNWATDAVFGHRSRSYKRKIGRTASGWKRMSLLYLLDESPEVTVRCRVGCYWLYCFIVLIEATIFFAIGTGTMASSKAIFFCFPLLLLNTVIWFLWRIYKKK